ncbi:hypothetical protein HK405_014690, partial [Cladochytrium tenue]
RPARVTVSVAKRPASPSPLYADLLPKRQRPLDNETTGAAAAVLPSSPPQAKASGAPSSSHDAVTAAIGSSQKQAGTVVAAAAPASADHTSHAVAPAPHPPTAAPPPTPLTRTVKLYDSTHAPKSAIVSLAAGADSTHLSGTSPTSAARAPPAYGSTRSYLPAPTSHDIAARLGRAASLPGPPHWQLPAVSTMRPSSASDLNSLGSPTSSVGRLPVALEASPSTSTSLTLTRALSAASDSSPPARMNGAALRKCAECGWFHREGDTCPDLPGGKGAGPLPGIPFGLSQPAAKAGDSIIEHFERSISERISVSSSASSSSSATERVSVARQPMAEGVSVASSSSSSSAEGLPKLEIRERPSNQHQMADLLTAGSKKRCPVHPRQRHTMAQCWDLQRNPNLIANFVPTIRPHPLPDPPVAARPAKHAAVAATLNRHAQAGDPKPPNLPKGWYLCSFCSRGHAPKTSCKLAKKASVFAPDAGVGVSPATKAAVTVAATAGVQEQALRFTSATAKSAGTDATTSLKVAAFVATTKSAATPAAPEVVAAAQSSDAGANRTPVLPPLPSTTFLTLPKASTDTSPAVLRKPVVVLAPPSLLPAVTAAQTATARDIIDER